MIVVCCQRMVVDGSAVIQLTTMPDLLRSYMVRLRIVVAGFLVD